jgi:uncharacterized protein YbjT (DUF2867 family)
MKILVIGASGLLAKPVVKHLGNNGFDLRLFSRTVNESMFYDEYDIQQGDVFNDSELQKAITECNAIHISIASLNEADAVDAILKTAKRQKVKLISYVSGCTVSEENRWFPMIDNKFRAEQSIINSGIPYMIFRPTWFFESLQLMVRNNKATVIGKQLNPYRWIAADDFARMVCNAYLNSEAKNKMFYVLGKEKFLMKELLSEYCKVYHPEIKKVSNAPIGLLKFLSFITGNKELKKATQLFSYFEKVKEPEVLNEADKLLGKPEITFQKWIETKD